MKLSNVTSCIQSANVARTPLYLWGAPGIGKTAIVEAAANALAVRLLTLRVNLLEPVDFLGLPTPSENGHQVKWLEPDFLPQPGTTGILFLDEFAQATQATQCAAMRLVDHLPDGWQVIAASNRSTDRAGAGQVATHVLSRFTHLEVDVSREDWQSWAVGKIRPEVRAFIDFRPGLLFSFDAQTVQKERANCSPRSWHRASRILESCDRENLLEMLTGTIGQGAAAEFVGFLRVFADCPSPDLILADPSTTPIPREPSAIYAVCAALADRARTLDQRGLVALVNYLIRMPVEFGALLITDILRIAPTVLSIPAALEWTRKNASLFASPRS